MAAILPFATSPCCLVWFVFYPVRLIPYSWSTLSCPVSVIPYANLVRRVVYIHICLWIPSSHSIIPGVNYFNSIAYYTGYIERVKLLDDELLALLSPTCRSHSNWWRSHLFCHFSPLHTQQKLLFLTYHNFIYLRVANGGTVSSSRLFVHRKYVLSISIAWDTIKPRNVSHVMYPCLEDAP